MLLPNADRAIVDRAKLEGYLLSFEHPQGRGKALFFARFGYWRANWETLREALLQQAKTERATELPANDFGRKYAVEGPLASPGGRTPIVRAIWFIPVAGEIPVFVTAFPGKEDHK